MSNSRTDTAKRADIECYNEALDSALRDFPQFVNIALIIHELLVEGGGERLIVCLARALSRQGHNVTIYTSAYDRARCFPEICKDIKIIEIGRGRLPWLRKPSFFRGYLDLRRLASRIDYKHEIWNAHHWPGQWAAVWLKRRLGGTVLWMSNDIPNLHGKAHQLRSLSDLVYLPLYWFYYLYDRAQNRTVDLTVLLSKRAEDSFKAIYQGKTCRLGCGADPELFYPGGDRRKIRQRFGYKEKEFVLLWLGIFMPHRRLEDAIEALARLKQRGIEVRLLLAGSDFLYPEYARSLRALTSELGLQEAVTFAGKVADEEIRDFYCACDAFVFPNDHQTWGLAPLEAMACGAPALVSTGSGVSEVLTDNQTAVLFPPCNPEALAAKIEVLVRQPELRRQIAESGMELSRTKYNWDCYAEQVSRICYQLVGKSMPQTGAVIEPQPVRDRST